MKPFIEGAMKFQEDVFPAMSGLFQTGHQPESGGAVHCLFR